MPNENQSNPSILIIAGEASSALYAKRLLEFWQDRNQKVEAYGVGDRAMEKLGFECLGLSEEMGVVGFKEVLSKWSLISGVFDKIVDRARASKPNVALLLDYPGFNLRLAKKLKALGIPVIYYISPQLWAWKKGRIKQVQDYVDKMLVLFPFEEGFYEEHGVPVEFVGHPLLDELNPGLFDKKESLENRNRYGIKDSETLIALMPGSRHSELDYNLDRQVQVARKLYKDNKDKDVKFALFVAPTLSVDEVKGRMHDLDFPLMFIQDDPFEMIRLADLVLTASGTATIFVGLLSKPMAIMYIMNGLTAWLARRLVDSTPFFGMVNIILQEEVGREFFQEQASVKNLAAEIQKLLDDRDYRQEKVEKLSQLKNLLGNKGATERVAESLSSYLWGME